VMRHIMPFFLAMVIVLFIVTYVPWFAMFVPSVLKLF
jgi:TRAP-type C4-dicarboxylate transport system permease large subunit